MYPKILAKMRAAVRDGRIVLTQHAVKEMLNDNLFEEDLEHCFLAGSITERQWDGDWDERKYVIEGESTDGEAIAAVARFGFADDVVVITTFIL